jgi:hypothetical protein
MCTPGELDDHLARKTERSLREKKYKEKLRDQHNEVLTALVMPSPIFWHIRMCSPSRLNRHFGITSNSSLKNMTLEAGTK